MEIKKKRISNAIYIGWQVGLNITAR